MVSDAEKRAEYAGRFERTRRIAVRTALAHEATETDARRYVLEVGGSAGTFPHLVSEADLSALWRVLTRVLTGEAPPVSTDDVSDL